MLESIKVDLSQRGEWFVATSPELQGLFVAEPSFAELEGAISDAIKVIYKHKYKKDFVVERLASPAKRSLNDMVYSAKEAA